MVEAEVVVVEASQRRYAESKRPLYAILSLFAMRHVCVLLVIKTSSMKGVKNTDY